MANILIVEDEKPISELLAINLQMTGHRCVQAYSGKDAVALARDSVYDLMLLDIMLPDIDGFGVMEKIRDIPAIFLTARHETADKVRGFKLGADDYITPPFEVTELLLRVQAVLRRTQKTEAVFSSGDLLVRFDSRQAFLRGEAVELTLQEFNLLQILIENRNIALTRPRLLTEAWGINFMGESRTVDVHIQKLRKKLELEERINTVFKVGYRFED